MRRALEQKLEQLSPLLRSEEHWDQAIALLRSLDDPELWKAVLDTMDERHLDRRVVGLLARIPDDVPGAREKRRSYHSVRLNNDSLLDAQLTPNIERVWFVRTRFGAGTGCPSWLAELRKLSRLKRLELNGVEIDDPAVLDLPTLEHLRLTQCVLHHLPDLPNVHQLSLRDVRGIRTLGRVPNIKTLEVTRGQGIDEARLAMLTSERLEHVLLETSSIATLEFLESPIAQDAPLRTLVLSSVARLVSIDGLRGARHLRSLSISHTPLDDVEVVATLPHLERLSLYRTRVRSLQPLAHASELRELDLTGCEWIMSLQPLCKLPKLEKVILLDTPFTPANVPDVLRDRARWPSRDLPDN